MPDFEQWCGVLSARLEDYTGRALADAPVWMIRTLPEWYQRGLAASDVAERLADCRWPAKATLIKFYTDRRPVEILAKFAN